jgi:ribonuclease P/MRP protein subunit POP8
MAGNGDVTMGEATVEASESPEDVSMQETEANTSKRPKSPKSHEITTRTIKTPAFSYACLELISDQPSKIELDNLTVRSYLTAALTQFLGITGSAISVDILKVDGKETWIRVPREDLRAVVAAVGGWVGGRQNDIKVGWRVRKSGNWLGSLVGGRSVDDIWSA